MNEQEYERYKAESRRIMDGDGTLRLWIVTFKLMKRASAGPFDRHVLDPDLQAVQDNYIRILTRMGALAGAFTMQGSPHHHVWWTWSDGYKEAETLVRASPASHFAKLYRIEAEHPLNPGHLSPQTQRALRPPKRHPLIRKLLRNELKLSEVFEAIEHSDHLDDDESFMMQFIFWGWLQQQWKIPNNPLLPPGLESSDDLWQRLVRLSKAFIHVDNSMDALAKSEREMRRIEAPFREFGIDVDELRRRAKEYHDRGEPLPLDFWENLPMQHHIEFDPDPPPDDPDEEDEESG